MFATEAALRAAMLMDSSKFPRLIPRGGVSHIPRSIYISHGRQPVALGENWRLPAQ